MTRSMRRPLLGAMCLLVGGIVCAQDQPASTPTTRRLAVSTFQYRLPGVTLVRQSGQAVSFADEVDDGRPVVLNFIFTSCGAICPMMTQTLSRFQDLLGSESSRVHLMSVSIDPEQDTPRRLRSYAAKFHAGPEWTFYTGAPEASIAAQKAFNIYRGDKMSHTAVTFMRSSPGASWRRLDGFATPEDLLREFRAATASR